MPYRRGICLSPAYRAIQSGMTAQRNPRFRQLTTRRVQRPHVENRLVFVDIELAVVGRRRAILQIAAVAASQSMLELDPAKRPGSAAEVRQALGLVPGPVVPQVVEKPKVRLCPVCQHELKATPQAKVEIDCCPHCGGVWLDRGELEQLVEVAEVYPEPPRKRTFWEQLTALIKG